MNFKTNNLQDLANIVEKAEKEKVYSQLKKYFGKQVIHTVEKLFEKEEITQVEMAKYFETKTYQDYKRLETSVANDISKILFLGRNNLKENKFHDKLKNACDKFYEKNVNHNLILGEGALEPVGTADMYYGKGEDPNYQGPLKYESPY